MDAEKVMTVVTVAMISITTVTVIWMAVRHFFGRRQ